MPLVVYEQSTALEMRSSSAFKCSESHYVGQCLQRKVAAPLYVEIS